jgi:hypothetical protein
MSRIDSPDPTRDRRTGARPAGSGRSHTRLAITRIDGPQQQFTVVEPVHDRPGLLARARDRRSTGSATRAGPVIIGPVLDR